MAVTDIGTKSGDLPAAVASALVGAGMLSVLLFPLVALAQRRTSGSRDEEIAVDEDVLGGVSVVTHARSLLVC